MKCEWSTQLKLIGSFYNTPFESQGIMYNTPSNLICRFAHARWIEMCSQSLMIIFQSPLKKKKKKKFVRNIILTGRSFIRTLSGAVSNALQKNRAGLINCDIQSPWQAKPGGPHASIMKCCHYSDARFRYWIMICF